MKNKLKIFNSKKTSISLIGLSLVLAGGLLCIPSYADKGSHSHDYNWSINSSAPYKALRKCSCGDYAKSHSYDDPTITLTLNNEFETSKDSSNVTTPDGIVAFEEGITLTLGKNYFKSSANHEDDDAPSKLPDSILSHKAYIDGIEKADLKTTSELSLVSQSPGERTLKVTTKDWYYNTTNSASTEVKFYIGPYPTIYYTAHLTDDNNASYHHDTIQIKNIKLLSTYLPKEKEGLTFYICDSANPNTSPIIKLKANRTGYKEYVVNGTTKVGYISTFELDPISKNIAENIQPLQNPYIMTKINDGRTGTPDPTDPTKAKWAKYNTYISSL